eukprot:scaffold66917_cov45-Prasinocladus_malaysianus.AAC.2
MSRRRRREVVKRSGVGSRDESGAGRARGPLALGTSRGICKGTDPLGRARARSPLGYEYEYE